VSIKDLEAAEEMISELKVFFDDFVPREEIEE